MSEPPASSRETAEPATAPGGPGEGGSQVPPTRRAGARWWGVAVVSVAVGAVAGVGVARAAAPASGSGNGGDRLSTSSGGIFTRGSRLPAAPWSLPRLQDAKRSLSLAELRGKPLVLNFWASWCPPCRSEMPALEAVHRELGAKVEFVGIDTQDTAASARAFVAKTKVSYPVLSDTRHEWSSYGVYGLPTTVFISANGRILARQVGGMTASRLRHLLKQVYGKSF